MEKEIALTYFKKILSK